MKRRKPHVATKRCGAKTRAGHPCRNWPLHGRTRCKFHGGKTKTGMDAPAFKHGRYSAYVPDNLLAAYNEAITDPDLLSMRDNVAVLDARIIELLSDANTGAASAELWESLIDEWARFMVAIKSGNQRNQGRSINRLNQIINDGATAAAAWRELYTVTEHRRRSVETEQRVITTRETMITIETALLILTAQIEAIKTALVKHVDDQQTRVRIIDAAVEANRRILGNPANS